MFPLLELPQNSLGNYFEPDPYAYVNQHSYGLRSRTNNVPTRLLCHSKFAEKSCQIGGLRLWNKIPEVIQDSISLNSFKSSYKKYLLDFSNDQDDSILSQ